MHFFTRNFRTFLFFVFIVLVTFRIEASENNGIHKFNLVNNNDVVSICYDASDFPVVGKTVSLFANDVYNVTGVLPKIYNNKVNGKNVIIVGTIQRSKLIKDLVEKGKIDISFIENSWERYMIKTIDKPYPGVEKALVIAGSDRRGTAYGLLSLSEKIGVSPWYWWADVPIQKQKKLIISVSDFISQSPSVKYRGIFLNDEDWGLTPWASKTFEKERGNIGPKTYSRIFELLLRLRANYLAPAMHPVSTAFNQIPENKMVADTFAIVMGSTHCEPLLLNTASEWDKKTMGEWNYDRNKNGIYNILSKRVAENAPYENVYTLALRGLHDAAMGVGMPMEKKVKLLENALDDQRKILTEHIHKPIDSIPQVFTPYKEVLEIYSNGLKLPDDVTIVWPDDNYGYFKRLSGYEEQKRSGRSGVYYHVSYLGVPHSYLWFSTTPPALMYEELKKAYDTTADRLWLLNCGDLKGSEMQVNLFLDMAYDINKFSQENVVEYPARWLADMLNELNYKQIKEITDLHYHLAFSHKPEYMGWGYHWNKFDTPCEILTDTEYSFINYNEAENRLYNYRMIGTKVENILNSLPEESQAAFFELLYYPVKGAELMNRMTLGGQKNRWYARQKRVITNDIKKEVEVCFDSLQIITDRYNTMLDGKWRNMMSLRQNYDNVSAYFKLPKMEDFTPIDKFDYDLQIDGQNLVAGSPSIYMLPCFNVYIPDTYWFEIYNKGKEKIDWKAETSDNWIVLSDYKGRISCQKKIEVSINWKKVPIGANIKGYIDIKTKKDSRRIWVSVYNEELKTELKGLFIENNGYISIPASDFHRKKENKDIKINVVEGLGFENKSLQLGDPVAPLQIYRAPNVPKVEYDFYSFSAGMVDVYTYVLPTFPLHKDRDFRLPESTNSDTKYSICIDNGSLSTPSTSAVEYSQKWFEGVLCNCTINKSTLYVDKPGKHTLQIRCGDPGIIIQKIVMDFGGLRKSLIGPSSTQFR